MSWNETTETETFDLDAAVAELVERREQATREDAEAKARKRAQIAADAEQRAHARITRVIPRAAQEALGMGPAEYDPSYQQTIVRFTAGDGQEWALRTYGPEWQIIAPHQPLLVGGVYSDASLMEGIVATIANERQRAHAAEQRAREEAEARRKQEAEHAAIERELTTAKALAAREIWQWPEDVALTLFKWTWQRGRDEEGGGDYEEAWATEEELDDRGYLPLADGRVIRLIPTVHMPIVERRAFLATEELPYRLREQVTLSVPGVTTYTFYDEATDEHHQWYRRDEHATLRLTIGQRPVAWVRAMLADDSEPTPEPQPQPEPEPAGADMPTLTNPAFDLPF